MEILTLMGTPPVVANTSSSTLATSLFSVSPVTQVFDAVNNQPGQYFNADVVPYSTSGWSPYAHQLQFTANSGTFKDDTYDRMVLGFRIVNKGGFKGINGQNPYLQTIAVQRPAGGNSLYTLPFPLSPHLNGDEGQYIEVVIDWKTGKFEFYVDGGYVGTTKFPAVAGINPELYGVGFRIYQDMTAIPYARTIVSGYYRDLYMGGLSVGEVFEPLGDITVTSLPTVSATLNPNFMGSGNIESWGGGVSVGTVLDSAGTKLYTQTFANPAPLKAAFAISGICSSLDGTGYIEASSNGAKIAGDIPIRGRPATRILQIKPADIGNDLVVSFKIDP